MNTFKTIICLFFGVIILSCEPSGKKPSDMTPQELVKSREIRKISDLDILESGKIFRNEIMNLINNRMGLLLNSDSISFKNLTKFLSEVQADSTLLTSSIVLKLILMDSDIKMYQPDQIESQILEACVYSLDNGIAISETVQMSDDNKAVRYIEPILINQKLIGLWSLKIPKKSIISAMD